MRSTLIIFLLLTLLAGCSNKQTLSSAAEAPAIHATAGSPSGGFILAPDHQHPRFRGDFSTNPSMVRFIDNMVSKHGFDRQQLYVVLAQAKRLDNVLRLMERQAPGYQSPAGPNGAWIRYRDKFIKPDNVEKGVAFWDQYQDALNRAHQLYGVPAEIITGIIGVETRWGEVMGKTRIVDALATLAFAYPRRAGYFTKELEIFLLMARQEQQDPLALRGSFAGAMGFGQFMPSSFRDYAVDFNGDGQVNLWDPVDAIGSVANYFQRHGWQSHSTIAVPANGQAPGLKTGYATRYNLSTLIAAGVTPQVPLLNQQQVSLLKFDIGTRYQYWYGLKNFYVITRYNHSNHYAMAVWQLGQAVAQARLRRVRQG